MKRFLTNVVGESILFGSLIAWQGLGYQGGENLFLFLAWFLVIGALLLALTEAGRKSLREEKRGPLRIAYFSLRNVVMLVILAWLGMFFLAAFWLTSLLLVYGARNTEPKVA